MNTKDAIKAAEAVAGFLSSNIEKGVVSGGFDRVRLNFATKDGAVQFSGSARDNVYMYRGIMKNPDVYTVTLFTRPAKWGPMPTCDYGTESAEYYERSAGEPPICGAHAREHYGTDWRSLVGRIGPKWHARQQAV